jgi:nicotinate-nucleotide adenylyltransferase
MKVVRRRLGLFGGTFDPPHLGHAAVLDAALASGWFDEILVTVARDPWQKAASEVTPAAERFLWASLAFGDRDGVTVSDRELRRQGPTYTADTVRALLADADVTLIVGADTATTLPTWHDASWLASAVDVAIVPRSDHHTPAPAPWVSRLLPMASVDLSSTVIRSLGPDEEGIARVLHPAVYARWRAVTGVHC